MKLNRNMKETCILGFEIIIIAVLILKMFYKTEQIAEIYSKQIKFLVFMNIALVLVIIFLILIMYWNKKNNKKFTDKNFSVDNSSCNCKIKNRSEFIKASDLILKNKNKCKFALVNYDIEKFKMINDTCGYKVGDMILNEISNVLNNSVKNREICGRSYADDFVVLFEYKESIEELLHKANDVSLKIERMNIWKRYNLMPVISTGIYFITDKDTEIRAAMDMAKIAKKDIKGRYKSGYAIYNEKMRHALIEEKKIENDMQNALANQNFKVFFQPKINLVNGKISGSEALVRWQHDTLGLLGPIKFIPLFEKNGFIIKLDEYVFEQVCILLRKWLDKGYKVVPVSVNVSRLHFYSLNFVSKYENIKKKYDIPDGLIEIEVTESVVLGNITDIFSTMKDFKDGGFDISMDDFGSGYSSLGLLKDMPIDTIKLDKIFLDHFEDDNTKMVVNNVVELAKNLHLNIVSEGVESMLQVNFLKNIGCDMAQGYVFSKPVTANEYEKIISNDKEFVIQ